MSETTETAAPANSVSVDQLSDDVLFSEFQRRGHYAYSKEFSITSPDVITADPFLKQINDTVYSTQLKNLLNPIDDVVREIPGMTKGPNEKTTEFVRRAVMTLSERTKSAPDVDAIKSTYEAEKQNLINSFNQRLATSAVSAAASGLALNVAEGQTEAIRSYIVSEALKTPYRVDDNGGIVFQKKASDGETLIDITDPHSHKPVSVDRFLADQFKSFVAATPAKPAGNGVVPAGAAGNATTVTVTPTTKAALTEMLLAKGMQLGSADYLKAYAQGLNDYALHSSRV